jgi:hypothetical protein
MCTAMLYDPAEKKVEEEERFKQISKKANLLKRIEAKLKSFTKMVTVSLAQ